MSHYLISEASRLVDEESHVLRYWEEELALKIPRNDLGHRYYTEVQLDIFRTIKELKQQGYQLREIKQFLEEMEKDKPDGKETEDIPEDEPDKGGFADVPIIVPPTDLTDELPQQSRMREFRELMTAILTDAMEKSIERISDEISEEVSCRVIKEMNYLDREREEREEERFKELDAAIRSRQRWGKYKAEVAATAVQKKGMFGHRKKSYLD